MATQYHVNPRFRAYGRARLEIARRASTRAEWNELWKPPQNEFPFTWGRHWKHCVEYRVDDYAAEAGFFIDVLGFPVNAFDPQYAQFTGPDGEFFIAFLPAGPDNPATPADALRLQFMVSDLLATTRELDRRGVVFDQEPQPLASGSSLSVASFHTPHGIQVDLWGEAEYGESPAKPTAASPTLEKTETSEDSKRPARAISQPLHKPPAPQALQRPVTTMPSPKPAPRVERPTTKSERIEPDSAAENEQREVPQVDHFFPVRAPGSSVPAKKKLRIRLADPRPLLLRDPA